VSLSGPNISFDNGNPCNPIGLLQGTSAVCNGKVEVIYGFSDHYLIDVHLNGEVIPLGGSAAFGEVVVNSAGYVAWDNGSLDEIFEAVPDIPISQTPEPSSLILFATGLLGAFGLSHSRRNLTSQ
jgi:hypothetical protein